MRAQSSTQVKEEPAEFFKRHILPNEISLSLYTAMNY